MAHIDCVVDTHPMAQSINSVKKHIDGTTAAVVGMKVAVLKAESDAADSVCANVNRGFYTLIRSQITQKMAALRSQVDSHLMQLNQQRKQLKGIRTRMEHDYSNISQRYLKLFTSINRNLRQRVTELDRPVMDFATKDMEKINNRTTRLAATVPVGQEESVRSSQRIVASNLKYRGLQVVESASRFLESSRRLQDITSRILLPERLEQENRGILYPAIIWEARLDDNDNRSMQIAVSTTALDERAQSALRRAVNSATPTMQWSADEGCPDALRNEFHHLLQSVPMNERVRKMAASLFDKGRIETVKKA